jgi:hypothetical protein
MNIAGNYVRILRYALRELTNIVYIRLMGDYHLGLQEVIQDRFHQEMFSVLLPALQAPEARSVHVRQHNPM